VEHEGEARVNEILVVDDSHVIRRLVEVVLEQIHLHVVTAATGSMACEILEHDRPAVVILDVGLPDMSGWEVLEFVRDRPELDGTAVIMLTGHADADDIDRAANLGADEYLLKPFRPDELRRLVLDTIHSSANVADQPRSAAS
jgi:DNA-binding response OmpR family regulator